MIRQKDPFNFTPEDPRSRLHENTTYKNDINKTISLILDLQSGSFNTDKIGFNSSGESGSGSELKGRLSEPLVIDSITDIYLDSVIVVNVLANTTTHASGFLLNIVEFDIRNNTNNSKMKNKLLINNEKISDDTNGVLMKGKKLNFVSTLTPTVIHKLSGKLTLLDGSSKIFREGSDSHNRITLEFILKKR